LDLVANHGALEALFDHDAFEFGNRRLDVLHRQGAETGEALRPALDHLADFVIRFARGGDGNGGIQVIVIKAGVG
jgi:hypothetical protein